MTFKQPSSFSRLRRTTLVAAAITTLCAAWPALASDAAATYPDKPIRLIVPYTPGGATDVIGRVIAQRLGTSLGQSVVVENRPGAAGNLGAAQVANAQPDGYTLLLGALTSHSINSVLQPSMAGFTMDKSFAPVSIVGRVPLLVVVGPSFKGKTLGDLIASAKSQPGKLNYGSSGNGSPQHLAAELFKRQAGVDILQVPYKGSSQSLNDLMGGQVDVVFDTLSAAQGMVKGGRLQALAITTPERNPALPDVPTSAEAGLKDFEVTSMFGVLAPAGTPAPIIDKLNASLKDILSQQEVKDALTVQGAIPVYTTPAEAAGEINKEVARWTKVIQDSNIKVD